MARMTSDCSNLSRIMAWSMLDLAWGSALCGTILLMMCLSWRLALVVITIAPMLIIISRYFQVRLLKTSRDLRKANSQTTAAFNEGIVGGANHQIDGARRKKRRGVFASHAGHVHPCGAKRDLRLDVLADDAFGLRNRNGAGVAIWRDRCDSRHDDARRPGNVFADRFLHPVSRAGIDQFDHADPGRRHRPSACRACSMRMSRSRILRPSSRISAISVDTGDRMCNRWHGRPRSHDRIPQRRLRLPRRTDGSVRFQSHRHAGESIAIVGPTGGGKTTIVGLACRFYEPTSGQILINGVDYRERSLNWLQSNLGMVLQQPYLFSGTVRDNIRYGRLPQPMNKSSKPQN